MCQTRNTYMILLIHVLIALSSIVYTTYLFIFPVLSRFRVAYMLIGSTLITGTFLVISTHSNLLQACTTGLAYLGVVSFGIAVARKRLPDAPE